jgi:hypothetical protein
VLGEHAKKVREGEGGREGGRVIAHAPFVPAESELVL